MRRIIIVGLAAALIGCAAPETGSAAPQRFTAIGQEPFFSLQLTEEGFVLSQPEAPDLKAPSVEARPIDEGWAFATRVYDVAVRRAPCIAPSGETQPYTVEITLTAAGLAELKGAAGPAMTGCGGPN